MNKITALVFGCFALGVTAVNSFAANAKTPPNIVYILCDDLGYGDVKSLNPDGKIATPNLDRLAAEGMKFTDAHSTSSVCTPTRYSILTGRYNWRSRLKYGVLNGYSPKLIEEGRITVAEFLRNQSYDTAIIGKWHLGMNWSQNDGKAPGNSSDIKKLDLTKPIEGGPTTVGFDYFFGISASLDMAPYAYLENDRFITIPTKMTTVNPDNPYDRPGLIADGFSPEEVLPTLTSKAIDYINKKAPTAKQGQPFFLYMPITSPHTPILPTKEWQGKSGLNDYADFVMMTDAMIGKVVDALKQQGIDENTMIVVTSDNGCSRSANYAQLLAKGHNPSYIYRGSKSDIWDGGHRVPLIVRWPAEVKGGTTSDQIVSLSDLFATCADILDKPLSDNMAEDSMSFLPALQQKASDSVRSTIVHSAIYGAFAIRDGNWKLNLCPGSGGWSTPEPGSPEEQELPPLQLYDLSNDPEEKNNLAAQHPEIVARLTQLLEKYIADGRSTLGQIQPNTGAVELYPKKRGKPATKGANQATAPAKSEAGAVQVPVLAPKPGATRL